MIEIIRSIEEMKRPIRYAFFDLGGVVFSFSNGLKVLAEKVNRPLEVVSTYWRSQDDAICRGELDPQQFWINLASQSGISDRGFDFLEFWVDHFTPIQSTHDALRVLHDRGVQIGILTNIYPGVFERAKDIGVIPDLDYHTIVKSCDIKIVKPDLQIFKFAIEQIDLSPREVLLIDDQAENTQAVESMGWNSLLFK